MAKVSAEINSKYNDICNGATMMLKLNNVKDYHMISALDATKFRLVASLNDNNNKICGFVKQNRGELRSPT